MIVAAAVVAGCGVPEVDFDIDAPDDRITVIFDGERTTIAQSGSVSVQIDGVPELSYSGALGCRGRYFTDSESDLYFRYSARDAYLLRYDRLYRFAGGPRRAGGRLIWSHAFDGDQVTVLANCPPPPKGSGSIG